MSGLVVSQWANATFGSAAAELSLAAFTAMNEAHELALRAHITAEMESNDTYGHTLKVKQFTTLVDEAAKISGIDTRKPQGGRFPLVVIPETNVALLPWRYSTDRHDLRERSRLGTPVSDLRQTLLGLNSSDSALQLTIEDALLDDAALEQRFLDEREVDEQLSRFGRIVVVGFGSNPSGIWGIGWGDVEIEDVATGAVRWPNWESLQEFAAAPAGELSWALRPTHALAEQTLELPERFDQVPDEDSFDLVARTPGTGVPISEPMREAQKANNGEQP